MILKKFMPVVVLCSGVGLGYVITSALYVPAPQQVLTAAELTSALDANCSPVVPQMPICEMPGEMSRADMLRLISPESIPEPAKVIQEMARSKSKQSSGDAESNSPEEKP